MITTHRGAEALRRIKKISVPLCLGVSDSLADFTKSQAARRTAVSVEK